MEPESSLPYPQVPTTCPCPEPAPSSPHNPLPLLKIPLNIIFPSTSGSPQWSRSLRLPNQNPVHTSPLPHTHHMPSPSFLILPPTLYWVRSILHMFWSKFCMHLSSPVWDTVFFRLLLLDLITGCLKKTQILKLLVVLFSPFFCSLFCFRSEYFFSTYTL
jgi:hypothetical protein